MRYTHFSALFIIFLVFSIIGCHSSSNKKNKVKIPNRAPIAKAGEDLKQMYSSVEIILDGQQSFDPDNDDLIYYWEFLQTPGPEEPSFYNRNAASTSFMPTAGVTGTYRALLTVSDGEFSVVDLIEIDIAENDGVTPDAGRDQFAQKGETIQLTAGVMEKLDSSNMEFHWTQLDSHCPNVMGENTRLMGRSITFNAPDQVCTVVFELRVDDGTGLSFADRVYIYVLEDPNNALFVDMNNGDDTASGFVSEPLASITNAVKTAQILQKKIDIYVAHGVYEEGMLELVEGVSIYGGYNDQFERDPSIYNTMLLNDNVVISANQVGNLIIDGLTIQQRNVEQNAVAMHLQSGTNITIRNNVIQAASAATGLHGNDGEPGINGGDGAKGFKGSCDDSHGLGGAGGDGAYIGGAGGRGGREGSHRGKPGEVGEGPLGGVAGKGGKGGSEGHNGVSGSAGGDGEAGSDGAPAPQLGSFDALGYHVPVADNGSDGAAGSGGGGGGGGGGQGGFFHNDGGGNGAGGGGGGGFGGQGGAGGSGGYASIALYLFAMESTIIENNLIISGDGGIGGHGGSGGIGGIGGLGGKGARKCTKSVGAGGDGGAGGQGGNGGHGGGGSGGPSIGIVYDSEHPITESGNVINIGTGGAGGMPNGSVGMNAETFNY